MNKQQKSTQVSIVGAGFQAYLPLTNLQNGIKVRVLESEKVGGLAAAFDVQEKLDRFYHHWFQMLKL